MTTTTSLGTILESILTVVKNDALKTALPVVSTLLSNVMNNTDPLNLTAQAAAFQVNLLAAVPNLEQAVVKDIAVIVQAQVAALAASAATPAAPAT